jgi:glutamyl-tRNA(Gln) amidotransferase subunit E
MKDGMKRTFNPAGNYERTRKRVGYRSRKKSGPAVYRKLGFKSGLEVHQQLKTREKLFCRCPAGIYQDLDDYDAEVVRHMRPTLSEMGTYDGTALMEFRTRKNIIYRIKNETTCTYDVDDTPPFPINREALDCAIEISLLLKQNIVGELHITRKQYLDGSIPTGFQRTAIVGIEGEIPLANKKVRIIQLSLEEDACREVSDIRHERVYTTDRLGIPLVETVTSPDMATPEEVREAAHYIRFLNRSSGKVRVGMGAAREDVNVSIEGGTRVEIKGVSRISRIPELTHNEAFRQKALLEIRKELLKRFQDPGKWRPVFKTFGFDATDIQYPPIKEAVDRGWRLVAGNLPGFRGILSFFTQPGRTFADELAGRLKVIACLEIPNMLHSEDLKPVFNEDLLERRSRLLGSGPKDAQIVIWTPEEDMATALETIEERCRMAFAGVPEETRKAMKDGTTVFERVLPGADRMYPDTDSAPIPIHDETIEEIRKRLPVDLRERLGLLKKWKVPEDTYPYILRNNLMPVMERIITDFSLEPGFVAALFAHHLKHAQGRIEPVTPFDYGRVYDLIRFLRDRDLQLDLIREMLPVIYRYPKMDFHDVLNTIHYRKVKPRDVMKNLGSLRRLFRQIGTSKNPGAETRWIMGNLRPAAVGNIPLKALRKEIDAALSQEEATDD